jgi:hypothetical protein
MLSTEEEERFDAWLRAQSEIATFFLDSIDELKLTLGSFEQALKRLNKAIAGQLGRSRVVITTRPIPVDQRLIRQHLPIPEKSEAGATGEAFANIAMSRHRQKPHEKAESKPWRNVALMPLSDEQIRKWRCFKKSPIPMLWPTFAAGMQKILPAGHKTSSSFVQTGATSPHPYALRAGCDQRSGEA